MTKLREMQIRDKACTVCDGIRSWGNGYRAISKKRCDTCGDGKNFHYVGEVGRGDKCSNCEILYPGKYIFVDNKGNCDKCGKLLIEKKK